jgi:hypothetical protein
MMKQKFYIWVVSLLAVLAGVFSTPHGDNRVYALVAPGGDFFPAVNPPATITAMANEDNRFLKFINQGFKPINYDFFVNIPGGMSLNKKEYPELITQKKANTVTHSLFWGSEHGGEHEKVYWI